MINKGPLKLLKSKKYLVNLFTSSIALKYPNKLPLFKKSGPQDWGLYLSWFGIDLNTEPK